MLPIEFEIKPVVTNVKTKTMGDNCSLPIVFTYHQCEEMFFSNSSVHLVLCVDQSKMTIEFCSSLTAAKYFYFGDHHHCGAV